MPVGLHGRFVPSLRRVAAPRMRFDEFGGKRRPGHVSILADSGRHCEWTRRVERYCAHVSGSEWSQLPDSLIAGSNDALVSLVEHQAQALGSSPFVTLPDERLSFGEVGDLARRSASVLAMHGVGRGDVVASIATNSRTSIAAWLGAQYVGAVHLPVNALLWGKPLHDVLSHARPKALIVEAGLWHQTEVSQVVDAVRGSVFIDQLVEQCPVNAFDFAVALDAANPADVVPQLLRPEEPGTLLYTSGTTGEPKGVVWSTMAESVWIKAYANEMLQLSPGEGAYTCLPLFHVTARGTFAGALRCGGRVTLDARFDPFGFWNRVREADAQVFTFVGTILSVLSKARPRADDADNPARRIVGAAAPADKWREVEQRFGLEIVETWGQTETAGCWLQPASMPQTAGTVGFPSERWKARLVDDDGNDIEHAGKAGEMFMRPLHPLAVFSGYAREAGVHEPSREVFTDDGWYRTGDLLVRNDDGSFAFAGRLREAIRRRGELIGASPIEDAARSVVDLAEVAAVGVPATHGSEEDIKLCVVPTPGTLVDPAELWGRLRDVLPAFMVPRYIQVLDELPKTPSTRIRKVALGELGVADAWDSSKRPAPTSEIT